MYVPVVICPIHVCIQKEKIGGVAVEKQIYPLVLRSWVDLQLVTTSAGLKGRMLALCLSAELNG